MAVSKVSLKEAKIYMTEKEQKLKRKLIKLLKDDGKGHKHAKFAERLKDFYVKIVPLKVDPKYTASMDFESGVIRISEGFLNDPETFFQLNVLMRHELAHYLMKHISRDIKKLNKLESSNLEDTFWDETLGVSANLHYLSNILADFEISNTRYTDEDKKTVTNMMLNGQVISGLVTDLDHPEFAKLTLEEMYDKVDTALTALHQRISQKIASYSYDSKANWEADERYNADWNWDVIKHQVNPTKDNTMDGKGALELYGYFTTLKDPTPFLKPLKYFLANKEVYVWDRLGDGPVQVLFSGLPKTTQDKVKKLLDLNLSNNDLQVNLVQLAASHPLRSYEILQNNDKTGIYIASSQEKLLVMDILKALQIEASPASELITWTWRAIRDAQKESRSTDLHKDLSDLIDILQKL